MPATKLKEIPGSSPTSYDADFYTWTLEQASALRDMKRDKQALPCECPYKLTGIPDHPFEWPQT